MKSLLNDGIYATATTRPNRKAFPRELKDAKLRHGECITMQRSGVTACSWQDKKKVNFLTTFCQPAGDDCHQKDKGWHATRGERATMCCVIQQIHGWR